MGNLILERWETVLQARAAKGAIFNGAGSRLRSFQEIEREAADLAGFLPDVEGRVVFLRLGNRPSFPAALLALIRHGAIPLPMERDAGEETLMHARRLTGAAGEIVQERERTVYRMFSAREVPEIPADFMKLSSGTTGLPKAIRFSWTQIAADCDAITVGMGIRPGDRNFGLISLAHSYGFSNLVTPLLLAGVPLVLPGDLLPAGIPDAMVESCSTVFPGVPKLFELLSRTTGDLGALRLCISAGAPLAPAVSEAFAKRAGRGIHSFYGASECGGICYDPFGASSETGFVGQPLPGVKLIPSEEESGDGVRYFVESPAVAEGYWPDDAPELSGGRYLPGDLLVENSGDFRITGRVSDFINVAGRKLNPSEVEAAIAEFPAIREVVVFGVEEPGRGEVAIAWIVLETETSVSDVRRYCAERLSAWQVPREIRVVETIPRSSRGKINRVELAALELQRRT